MGFGGISIWQLLIILVVVLLIFGSGKLKSLGSDLGSSIKGFKKQLKKTNLKKKKTKIVSNWLFRNFNYSYIRSGDYWAY